MSTKKYVSHILVVCLVLIVLTVDYVCPNKPSRRQDNNGLNNPTTADRERTATKAVKDEKTSEGKYTDQNRFMTQIPRHLDSPRNALSFTRIVSNPKPTSENVLTRNARKDSFEKKRQRRESSDLSCRFPSFLETSPLCLVSQLTPGKVCNWMHSRHGPLFPFPNITPPYRHWKVQATSDRMRSSDNRYSFDCVQQYFHNDQYLVKITGRFEEIGGKYQDYISFLCLRFIPRGLNVVQYMASKNSNTSENLNCGTEHLDVSEQFLIADKFLELHDCPRDLRGAFEIARVYDGINNTTCSLGPLKISLLESDCVDKEGIHMDFSAFRDCEEFNSDSNGIKYIRDVLYLRCYSASWKKDGWNYVVVNRDKTMGKLNYANKKMFYCVWFEKNPRTSNIKLYIFFDAICKFNFNQPKSSDNLFVFDLVPLTSSLLSTAQKSKLGQIKCDLPSSVQGTWIERSAYSGKSTISIGSKTIDLGPAGKFMCMLSDGGKGIRHLLPGNCDQHLWIERRRISHFNNSFILTSTNLPTGCRPRFAGFSISHAETKSDFHFTYRLSRSVVLPIDSLQDPAMFVQKSLPEMFCSNRDLFRLDPYPHWGHNIEKIVIRPNVLEANQLQFDCRFHGPLPHMFSGKFHVNIVEDGMENNKCSGSIDICSNPTEIRLQYGMSCPKRETRYGCLGRVWDTKQKRGLKHYLLQDLQTYQIYCARSDSGFEIARTASMQCYEFYWGLAAFQQQFHEKIDILAQSFTECPTKAPTTNAPSVVLEGGIQDLNITNITTARPQDNKKIVNTSTNLYLPKTLILIFAIHICLEYLLF